MAGLRILNVGSGRGVPLRDYVDALAAALSRCGVVPRLNYGAVPYRAGEPMHYVAEISKALETLKWHPRTTLEDGTRETVEKALGTR
jgi:nucleoside-diphosphate-sugar epimerase